MMVVMRSLLKKKKREANYFSTYIEAINGASQDLMEQVKILGIVWECSCGCVLKKFKFFLLKFNMVCIFWIVLMC
jgi:hypothetical protein